MCKIPKLYVLAEGIIDREIHANQSLLVRELLLKEHNFYENIENQYDKSEETIKEYLVHEVGLDKQMIEKLGEKERMELAYEEGFSPQPHEIYEWHLVSNWLAVELRLFDEPILNTEYGTWWGRTRANQSIIFDDVFMKIVQNFSEKEA